ncbi:Hypothetical predicted protein [Octopus vulgaris]|nr:uncharacterized protein LOC115231982 [Octopus sinensis]CAI9718021.1 Hypothetical predicted protein [Octopus vulgaris]
MAAKYSLVGGTLINILILSFTIQLVFVGVSESRQGCPANSVKEVICSSCFKLPETLQPLVSKCCIQPEALMLCEKCLRDNDHCQGEVMELLKLYIRSGNVVLNRNNGLAVSPESAFANRYRYLLMKRDYEPTTSTMSADYERSLLPEFLRQYKAFQLERRLDKLVSKREAEQMVAAPAVDERKRSGRVFTSRFRNRYSGYLSPTVTRLEPSGKIHLSDLEK